MHFLAWDRLGGVGERQAGGDGDRIEGAFLDPAVAAARLRMARPGRLSTAGPQLGVQAGLATFDGEDVVIAALCR